MRLYFTETLYWYPDRKIRCYRKPLADARGSDWSPDRERGFSARAQYHTVGTLGVASPTSGLIFAAQGIAKFVE